MSICQTTKTYSYFSIPPNQNKSWFHILLNKLHRFKFEDISQGLKTLKHLLLKTERQRILLSLCFSSSQMKPKLTKMNWGQGVKCFFIQNDGFKTIFFFLPFKHKVCISNSQTCLCKELHQKSTFYPSLSLNSDISTKKDIIT